MTPRVKYCFILLAMLALAVFPARAADELYVVRGVAVDVTAETAALAKDQGYEQAKRDALMIVLQRLLPPREIQQLGDVSALPVKKWVQGMEVNSEKTSKVRYIGNLNIFFNPASIRDFLNNKNYYFDEAVQKTWLVVPIYNFYGKQMVWEKENMWRDTWNKLSRQASVTAFRVPVGDDTDQKSFSLAALQQSDQGALQAMAQRYQAPQILVLTATPSLAGSDPQAVNSLVVNRHYYDGVGFVELEPVTATGGVGESLEALLQRTAGDVLKSLKDDIIAEVPQADADAPDYGIQQQMDVLVPVAGIDEWLRIESHLRTLSGLRQRKVRAISPQMVQMYWEPSVSVAQLNSSLQLIGRKLQPSGSVWMLESNSQTVE